MNWRACRPLVFFLGVLGAGAGLEAEEAPAYSSLAGTWTGTYSILQRGRCSMGRSGRIDAQIRITLTVDSDGAFQTKVASIRFGRDMRRLDAFAQFPGEGDPGSGQFSQTLLSSCGYRPG